MKLTLRGKLNPPLVLKNVYFAPRIGMNLISMPKLLCDRYLMLGLAAGQDYARGDGGVPGCWVFVCGILNGSVGPAHQFGLMYADMVDGGGPNGLDDQLESFVEDLSDRESCADVVRGRVLFVSY